MVDEDSIRYQKKISAGFNSLRDYLLETSYRYFLEIDKEYTDIQQEKVLLFLERMEQNTYDKKGKTVADDETGQELDSTEDNNDNEEKILEDTDSDELLGDSIVQKAGNQPDAGDLTWDQEKYDFVKEVLWQKDGKFVGLDHDIPLGTAGNGISLSEYY